MSPFLFSVPSMFRILIRVGRVWRPIPRVLQVCSSTKFSVAPLSKRTVCSTIALAVCTGMQRLMAFNLLMYIVRVLVALDQVIGFGCFKNPLLQAQCLQLLYPCLLC